MSLFSDIVFDFYITKQLFDQKATQNQIKISINFQSESWIDKVWACVAVVVVGSSVVISVKQSYSSGLEENKWDEPCFN